MINDDTCAPHDDKNSYCTHEDGTYLTSKYNTLYQLR